MKLSLEQFEQYWSDQQRRLWGVVGLLLIALVLRLGVGLVMPMDVTGDAKAYWTMASKLAQGNVMADHMGNHAYYSAGYPIFLGLLFKVFGIGSGVVLWANSILAVVTVYVIYLLGFALSRSVAVAFLASALWVFDLQSIVAANMIAKENLMIPLMTIATLLAARYRVGDYGKIIISGLIVGTLLVVGPTGAVVAVICAIVIVFREPLWRYRIIAAAIMVLGATSVVTPWLYRNDSVLSRPLINTNGGFNLYLGNNAAATAYYVGIEHTVMAEEWHRLRQEKGEVAASDHLASEAKRYISDRPCQSLGLAFKRVLAFWDVPTVVQPGISNLERFIRLIWFAQYCGLLLLSILSLFWWRQFMLIYGVIVGYVVVHMPFYVMSRYRLPVMIFLCLLASAAIVGWLRRRRAGPQMSIVTEP